MPSTRDIRRRIKSVKSTAQITKAMQLVAAAKMKKAQDQANNGRAYTEMLNKVLVNLKEQAEEGIHPFFSEGKGDKTLVRFTAPNDIRGTSFLVWEHPDGDDERFLYLPALGRVRRVAGQEKQESFVGSDLSYEDIGGRDVSDYSYAFASENATWTAPDGGKHAVWALESRAKDANAQFPRSVSLVLKDRLVSVHADIFNRRNERTKVFDVTRLERVDGIWSALDLVVANERDKTRTELTTSSLRYNVGLTDDDFSRRQLEQGTR